MDFGRKHRFWSVASRIYLELKNSRKIKIMLGNRHKTVSGDVIIAPEMMPIGKLWNPRKILATRVRIIDFPGNH